MCIIYSLMNSNYKIIFAFFLGVILRTLTNPWILGYGNENFSFHKKGNFLT